MQQNTASKGAFRARSGRTVRVGDDGTVMFDHANGYLSPASAMDAEEFYLDKRDRDLGRWRCPTDPEWVAREVERDAYGRRQVLVLNECTFEVRAYTHQNVADTASGEPVKYRVARAFFEAHPERKPWHDAKEGEIWAVTIRGEEHITRVMSPRDGISKDATEAAFLALDVAAPDWVYRESPWITAGRRIWPEDAS